MLSHGGSPERVHWPPPHAGGSAPLTGFFLSVATPPLSIYLPVVHPSISLARPSSWAGFLLILANIFCNHFWECVGFALPFGGNAVIFQMQTQLYSMAALAFLAQTCVWIPLDPQQQRIGVQTHQIDCISEGGQPGMIEQPQTKKAGRPDQVKSPSLEFGMSSHSKHRVWFPGFDHEKGRARVQNKEFCH